MEQYKQEFMCPDIHPGREFSLEQFKDIEMLTEHNKTPR